MKTAQSVIDRKGSHVATIAGNASVFDAATLMNKHHIGAVVVTDGDHAVGIFTERDVLNRIVAAGLDPRETPVEKVMTSPMACCRRDTSLDDCKSVMTQKRIRHLPVVEGGTLYGMISAGDVLASEVTEKQTTIEYLHEYLYAHR
ncbi:MAG: CBS domain-containing protein [Planctomycetes bacterium]|nr:CBS domain-containing protein [Planctomycetota bacterium]MBI3833639.1 CBS domain-containing protein [Planctomycetota bacterium]